MGQIASTLFEYACNPCLGININHNNTSLVCKHWRNLIIARENALDTETSPHYSSWPMRVPARFRAIIPLIVLPYVEQGSSMFSVCTSTAQSATRILTHSLFMVRHDYRQPRTCCCRYRCACIRPLYRDLFTSYSHLFRDPINRKSLIACAHRFDLREYDFVLFEDFGMQAEFAISRLCRLGSNVYLWFINYCIIEDSFGVSHVRVSEEDFTQAMDLFQRTNGRAYEEFINRYDHSRTMDHIMHYHWSYQVAAATIAQWLLALAE